MTAAELDRADIQGDILEAYGNDYARTSYMFLGVGDAGAGRRWLSDHLQDVTTALRWSGPKPASTFNLALTRAGLAALGVSERVIDSFSEEFCQGMGARAAELGDVDASAPSGWDVGLGAGAAHVLVTINALTPDALERALGGLRASVEQSGLSIVHELHARMHSDAREHFGFADGFSQPSIEGVSEQFVAGEGVPDSHGRWRPLALGEFLLGYEDEESRSDPRKRLPSSPAAPLDRNGTYMVWRKLRQDVALFRRTIDEASRLYERQDAELLMAKVVGRWRDGTPLVLAPTAPLPRFDAKALGANDFRYRDRDPDGVRCPLGAHIRRSNPRDALGFDGKLSFRHRIIRRGMPYGPELAPGALEDDGHERGLVFVCFNASLSRQFESIQRQWLNDGNSFHLGADSDFLLGGSGKMTIQGDPPFFLAPQGPFVTTRGGEYLFVPGITALAAIADGVAG